MGICTGLLLAPNDEIEIVPVYVPGAKPAGCTPTLKLAGVVPPELPSEIHLPPNAGDDADTGKLVFPADTESVWGLGTANPCW
jgi:hypothetical protein